MSQLTFRRLTRGDFPLVARWLGEPHVARWWDHEFTPEAIERDFGPTVDGDEPSEDHLAILDGDPFGLIQYSRFVDYPEYVAELAPILDVPAGAASIDYLVGDAERTGRGLGTEMIRSFVELIWERDQDVRCFIVPVNSANTASWKALLSAGFHLAAKGEMEPDNPVDQPMHEILRIDRPPAV